MPEGGAKQVQLIPQPVAPPALEVAPAAVDVKSPF
jgi:hypothetical protein